MKLQPLFDNIIVEEIEETAQKTKSGIILPKTVKEKPILAKVIEVGLGGELDGNKINFQIEKGDLVIFHRYSSAEFSSDGKQYLILKQTDILAKVVD